MKPVWERLLSGKFKGSDVVKRTGRAAPNKHKDVIPGGGYSARSACSINATGTCFSERRPATVSLHIWTGRICWSRHRPNNIMMFISSQPPGQLSFFPNALIESYKHHILFWIKLFCSIMVILNQRDMNLVTYDMYRDLLEYLTTHLLTFANLQPKLWTMGISISSVYFTILVLFNLLLITGRWISI